MSTILDAVSKTCASFFIRGSKHRKTDEKRTRLLRISRTTNTDDILTDVPYSIACRCQRYQHHFDLGYHNLITVVNVNVLVITIFLLKENPSLSLSLQFLIFVSQIETVSDSKKYLGEYVIVSRWIPEVTINITEHDGLLLFTQIPGSLGWSYLKLVKDYEFEVIYRAGLQCSVYGLGQDRERVIFDPPSTSGKSLRLKFGPYLFERMLPNAAKTTRSSTMNFSPFNML